jgi:hypothetical protein
MTLQVLASSIGLAWICHDLSYKIQYLLSRQIVKPVQRSFLSLATTSGPGYSPMSQLSNSLNCQWPRAECRALLWCRLPIIYVVTTLKV